jgi:hypothetical protein
VSLTFAPGESRLPKTAAFGGRDFVEGVGPGMPKAHLRCWKYPVVFFSALGFTSNKIEKEWFAG